MSDCWNYYNCYMLQLIVQTFVVQLLSLRSKVILIGYLISASLSYDMLQSVYQCCKGKLRGYIVLKKNVRLHKDREKIVIQSGVNNFNMFLWSNTNSNSFVFYINHKSVSVIAYRLLFQYFQNKCNFRQSTLRSSQQLKIMK